MMKVSLKVNGKKVNVDIPPDERLLDTLRKRLNLTGTKEGCGEGECGACTVLIDGKPVNSCLVLTAQVQDREITTIEGINSSKYAVIQDAFVETGAVQCGFCTPGFIMSTVALLSRNPDPDENEIKEALAGNLCRCTGYVQIIEAVKLAAKKLKD